MNSEKINKEKYKSYEILSVVANASWDAIWNKVKMGERWTFRWLS